MLKNAYAVPTMYADKLRFKNKLKKLLNNFGGAMAPCVLMNMCAGSVYFTEYDWSQGGMWMLIDPKTHVHVQKFERCSCQRNCGGRCSGKSIDLAKNFANEMDSVHRSFSSTQVL